MGKGDYVQPEIHTAKFCPFWSSFRAPMKVKYTDGVCDFFLSPNGAF